MKNKRLIILFSFLVFFIVLIVLSSTLFTLQNVTINWMTDKYQLKNIKDYDLTSKVSLGESIFLINKDDISNKLEKKYPYLRVVGVETKFPNKIIVHTAEREELFAIKKSNGDYAILDEFGKILNSDMSSSKFVELANSSLGGAPIEVDLNMTIQDGDLVEGEFIKSVSVKNLLSNLAYSFRQASYIPATSKGVFKYIKVEMSINIDTNEKEDIINIQTRRGIVIKLKDAKNHTTDKLLLGLSTYNEMHKDGDVNGTITVFYSDKLDKEVAY